MEGQCTGFGSLPFCLFSWSSHSCVWFFLEFPELQGQTLPRLDLVGVSETWKSHQETGIEPGDVVRGV